jgi:hypothetical protein
MKLFKYFAASLLAVAAANSTAALAQGGDVGGPPQDPVAIYKQAGVNEEQEGEIRRLAKSFEDGQRVRLKTLVGLIKGMSDLQLQSTPNEDEVLAKQDEINKLSNEMATERVKLLLKVRKVLKPEQRDKLVALIKEGKQKAQAAAQQAEETP